VLPSKQTFTKPFFP